jgi:hypothetical protein
MQHSSNPFSHFLTFWLLFEGCLKVCVTFEQELADLIQINS